jgi:hypothetical protein
MRRVLLLFFSLGCLLTTTGQEKSFFTTSDYDLNGQVQTCEVLNDYGREVFTFDRNGRLLRLETLFPGDDRNVTTYRFEEGELTEKRVEYVSNGVVDKSQSFLYSYSTSFEGELMKVEEDIVSYDTRFLEKRVFHYDYLGVLQRIVKSHSDALDEIRIERRKSGDTLIVEKWLNQELQQVDKTYTLQENDGLYKYHYSEDIFQGEPYEAERSRYNAAGKRVEYQKMFYDPGNDRYKTDATHTYTYDEKGALEKEIIQRGAAVYEKEYVFVFDSHKPANWIRKIQMPENAFVSRKITYFASGNEPDKSEDHR